MNNKTSWLSWRVWAMSALFWVLVGTVMLGTSLLQSDLGEQELSALAKALGWQMVVFAAPYSLVTPILLELTARLTRSRVTRRRFWSSLFVALIACVMLHTGVQALADRPYDGGRLPWWVIGMGIAYAIHYAAVLGFGLAVNQKRLADARERELLAAQLGALRAQLQPHFLFNTLHAISVTGRSDAAAASRMLTLLGDLLRQTLRERDGELVSLAEEAEMLRPYVELQKLRFGDRLRVEIDFPTDALAAVVPDLLLQPLVENALEHGIERRPEGGTVRIAARRWRDQLEIQVADDGPGIAATPGEVPLGVGLGTTRARLQALYGDAAELVLTSGAAGGATVTLRLPWREVACAA